MNLSKITALIKEWRARELHWKESGDMRAAMGYSVCAKDLEWELAHLKENNKKEQDYERQRT